MTETEPPGKTYQAMDDGPARRGRAGARQPRIVNAVELGDVTLAFGARTVLADVDLAIRDSEFVGVLGANGAGKTTLMRAILGLVPPRAGSDPRARRDRSARGNPAVGYMPQMRAALDHVRLTGWDFVASGAARPSLGPAAAGSERARRDVDWALDRVARQRPGAAAAG